MAAFTVNLNLVLEHPKALFDYGAAEGQKGVILSGLSFQSAYELEPKADGYRNVRPFKINPLSIHSLWQLKLCSRMRTILLSP